MTFLEKINLSSIVGSEIQFIEIPDDMLALKILDLSGNEKLESVIFPGKVKLETIDLRGCLLVTSDTVLQLKNLAKLVLTGKM